MKKLSLTLLSGLSLLALVACSNASSTGTSSSSSQTASSTQVSSSSSQTTASSSTTQASSTTASSAAISQEEAKSAALSDAGFSEDQVTWLQVYQDLEDGRSVYEVDFVNGTTEYQYSIDATSGQIVQKEQESVYD